MFLGRGCHDRPTLPRDEAILLHNPEQLLGLVEAIHDVVGQETATDHQGQRQNLLWITGQ